MKGNAEVFGRRRHLTRMYRRPGGLAVLVASAALALAAAANELRAANPAMPMWTQAAVRRWPEAADLCGS